jgi:hypothetical protein
MFSTCPRSVELINLFRLKMYLNCEIEMKFTIGILWREKNRNKLKFRKKSSKQWRNNGESPEIELGKRGNATSLNRLDLTSSEDLTQLDVQNNTLYCLVL